MRNRDLKFDLVRRWCLWDESWSGRLVGLWPGTQAPTNDLILRVERPPVWVTTCPVRSFRLFLPTFYFCQRRACCRFLSCSIWKACHPRIIIIVGFNVYLDLILLKDFFFVIPNTLFLGWIVLFFYIVLFYFVSWKTNKHGDIFMQSLKSLFRKLQFIFKALAMPEIHWLANLTAMHLIR